MVDATNESLGTSARLRTSIHAQRYVAHRECAEEQVNFAVKRNERSRGSAQKLLTAFQNSAKLSLHSFQNLFSHLHGPGM